MPTVRLVQFNNAQVYVEYDYNTSLGNKVVGVRCVNGTGQALRATIFRQTTGLLALQNTFLPNLTLVVAVVGGLAVTFDENGDPEFPYLASFEYPAP